MMRDESRQVTWDEAVAWAALVAAFYARHGRDPSYAECGDMIPTARALAAEGATLQ